MKNKIKTYLLLVLVLGIWGAIGYQILSVVNPETPQNIQQDLAVSFNPKIKTEANKFSIKIANRDPFLGTRLVKKVPIKKMVSKSKSVVWMPITYHGNISNQNNKTSVYIISIGGSQYLMKVGQIVKEIKLIRGNSKDVQLMYQGARKTIIKT